MDGVDASMAEFIRIAKACNRADAKDSGVKPVPCDDLKKRLELLTRYGVRIYRDGVLSIDLDPALLRKRGAIKDPDEQPEVPEM